jgi:hypothetical protein
MDGSLQLLREINDMNCSEGTFMDANTAASAEFFRYEGFLVFPLHDALGTRAIYGADPHAQPAAFLRMAFVFLQDSDTHKGKKETFLLKLLKKENPNPFKGVL